MEVPIELKLRYLNRRSKDLQALQKSLEQDDYSLAMKLGHQVKGNALTFDFPQMALLGLEMENAAFKQDKEKIKILVEKMEAVIRREEENYSLLS
jgi:HPt (histidine-containing phosphotransfer) domain-containing protein